MGVELNADDVFQMAEQIEKDAFAFYKQAASAFSDPARQQLLLSLASMEAEHELVFAAMKDHLTADGWHLAVPGDGAAKDWPVLVNVVASGVKEDLAGRFAGKQSGDQILRKAIDFEKDSIVFFLGMKDMLSDPGDKARIDAIIREELGHVLSLTGELFSPGGLAARGSD